MERLEDETLNQLLISRLPIKAKEPIITQTPPLNKLASIPFLWEEAPGKPRPNIVKIPAARCLDLPPRLLNNVKVSNVDDSPCSFSCQSLSVTPPSFSLSKGSYSFVGLEEEIDREGKDESKRLKLGSSWSWGSFKGRSRIACKAAASMSSVKICRVRRRSSFLRISQASSNLLAGVYGSFKQVVPWRWRQQQ